MPESRSHLQAKARHALLFALLTAMLMAGWAAGSAARADDTPYLAFAARIAGDTHRTRIIMDFDRKPDVSIHYIGSPSRILVDLPRTAFAFPKDALQSRGLVENIRYGAMGPGRARIVLLTKNPARIDLKKIDENPGGTGYRLVLDAVAVSKQVFDGLVKTQKWVDDTAAATAETVHASPAKPGAPKPFTVVLDPGHGGIDSGAVGINGTLEKDVTLAFAKVLRGELVSDGVDVVMTRDDDDFVSLADRVKIARDRQADLFVSIHANSVPQESVRGTIVYTLSDKASDKVSQRLAEAENKADAAAGLAVSEEPKGVANILMDLTRRETQVL
ncbi:MAG TPA: N-acetylmuramoyl-L-alanine amidase, partial [Pararhizobium sp.]|nr:N-acetylmuramoyl-L-alanine amidase [Pararhizobium sp.]